MNTKKIMKSLILIFTLKKIPILSWSSLDALNFKPKFLTLFYLIFGLILFGIGEALLITANLGVSPWTVLAQGMSFKSGYSIGITTFIVSISILILWIPLRQKPGIGTILNTISISIILDVSLPYLPSPESFLLQFLQIIIGVVIVGLGSGFYLTANLGPGSSQCSDSRLVFRRSSRNRDNYICFRDWTISFCRIVFCWSLYKVN